MDSVLSLNNGIFGQDCTVDNASIVIISVPWDLTCSYGVGSALNRQAIHEASLQLDLWDFNAQSAWKQGIALAPEFSDILSFNQNYRSDATLIYKELESGNFLSKDLLEAQTKINQYSELLLDKVSDSILSYLNQNKRVVLLGGEHSISLAYLRALSTLYKSFGVLQWDAHMDCRESYAGFNYSHASVMYHAAHIPELKHIVQVGIRDCCSTEIEFSKQAPSKIHTFFDRQLASDQFRGRLWSDICDEIIDKCPNYIYISCDIDGFDPSLCPSTGTPVPGGLSFNQWNYLLQELKRQGKTIIGSDLVEVVTNTKWDANVAARLLYQYSVIFS